MAEPMNFNCILLLTLFESHFASPIPSLKLPPLFSLAPTTSLARYVPVLCYIVNHSYLALLSSGWVYPQALPLSFIPPQLYSLLWLISYLLPQPVQANSMVALPELQVWPLNLTRKSSLTGSLPY